MILLTIKAIMKKMMVSMILGILQSQQMKIRTNYKNRRRDSKIRTTPIMTVVRIKL